MWSHDSSWPHHPHLPSPGSCHFNTWSPLGIRSRAICHKKILIFSWDGKFSNIHNITNTLVPKYFLIQGIRGELAWGLKLPGCHVRANRGPGSRDDVNQSVPLPMLVIWFTGQESLTEFSLWSICTLFLDENFHPLKASCRIFSGDIKHCFIQISVVFQFRKIQNDNGNGSIFFSFLKGERGSIQQ